MKFLTRSKNGLNQENEKISLMITIKTGRHTYCSFTSTWFMNFSDEEFENIDWDNDEQDYYSFHLMIFNMGR